MKAENFEKLIILLIIFKMRPLTPRVKAASKNYDESQTKFTTPSTKRPNKHSFLSTSPNFNSSKSPQQTPKVISKGCSKETLVFSLKEDLSKNIDEILGKVYDTVILKKNEREDVEIKQEILLKEIKTLEKEILPLVFKKKALLQDLEHEKVLFQQYEGSLRGLQEKAFKKKDEIQEKQEKMNEKITILTAKVKDLSQENSKIGNEIILQRNHQKGKIQELRREFEESKMLLKNVGTLEEEMKKKHDGMKNSHFERIDKLKNKERAFLGIIKH